MKWNNAFTNTPPLTDGFPKPITQQLFIKYKHKNTLPDGILYDSEIKTIGTFYKEDGVLFIIKGIGEVCLNDLEYCYWLDEIPEDYSDVKVPIYTIEKKIDWQLLEEKFCKEWNKRIFANNRMQYWEINQWYKDNI